MKKKFLSLIMATCMVAMVFAGCGQAETSGDDAKASVEESKDDKEETKEESKEESTEEVEESEEAVESTEEAEETEEVVESTEEVEETEEVVESTEEVAESEVAEETEEVEESDEEEVEDDTEAVVDSDIAKMYEGYMEKEDIIPENVMISATMTQGGVVMDMSIAHTADMDMMGFDLPMANMDIYVNEEKVYGRFELEGQEVWMCAPVESTEDTDSILSMSDGALVDPSTVTECVYRESVEEDGVVYDLLDIVIDDGFTTGSATYFVNRETQKLGKCVIDQEGSSVVCNIEEIETIELPADAESATEATIDDVMGYMMGVIFAGAGMVTE